MTTVAMMGSGSWGTAFAAVLADAGCQVTMWGRDQQVADSISFDRINPVYHPDVTLPQSLSATIDPGIALRGADVVVLAVPSQSLRANLEQWSDFRQPEVTYVSLMKGIELGTNDRMSQVIGEVTGASPDL